MIIAELSTAARSRLVSYHQLCVEPSAETEPIQGYVTFLLDKKYSFYGHWRRKFKSCCTFLPMYIGTCFWFQNCIFSFLLKQVLLLCIFHKKAIMFYYYYFEQSSLDLPKTNSGHNVGWFYWFCCLVG